MTLKELMNSSAALGFMDSVEDTALFYEAAQRALDILFTDKAIKRTVTVHKITPELNRLIPEYRHIGKNESFAVKVCGAALSFTTVGEGKYSLFFKDTNKKADFSGTEEHRIILDSGEAILTFYGSHAFRVRDIAVYSSTVSDRTEDVPLYDELYTVDIRALYDDYLSLYGEAYDKSGKARSIYEKGGLLYTPAALSGEITLTYRRKAPKIRDTGLDTPLNLPPECEALLPFLICSVLLLDDDSDKAQYYMALYRDMLTSQMTSGIGSGSARYVTNGWA